MKKLLLLSTMALVMLASCKQNNPSTSVTDTCGNTYKCVTIGTQTWMAENLKCNMYDTESEAYNASWLTDNTVPTSTDEVYTPYFTDATDKTQWNPDYDYSDNLSNEQIAKLGYLYNWSAAVGIEDGQIQTFEFTSERQGICPNGWHIPSKAEWQILYDYIYNDQQLSDNTVGKYLKTTTGWYDGDEQYKPGTDSYGFAALPSGGANGSSVNNVGYNTIFWTATPNEYSSYYAYDRYLNYYNDFLNDNNYSIKSYGRSVRCLKN